MQGLGTMLLKLAFRGNFSIAFLFDEFDFRLGHELLIASAFRERLQLPKRWYHPLTYWQLAHLGGNLG